MSVSTIMSELNKSGKKGAKTEAHPGKKGAKTEARPGKKGAKTEALSDVPPVYEPDIPEPTTREELMKYWIPISLDEKTAQKLLWLSEGGTKVTRASEHSCPVFNRPERYDVTPQVLCKEGLLGCRGYWEVDYEGWAVIGVVYASIGRKTEHGACALGENDSSWAVGWGGRNYQAWHDEESVEIHCDQGKTIGVYVDQPAGILAFYLVEGEPKKVKLLHRYKTSFKEKLLPAFWMGNKSLCWICKKE